MLIGGLQKTTLIDYPGKIACTVFTIGCNFRCPFCHNRELVSLKFFEEAGMTPIPEQEFFQFLEKRQKLLDGVCITGGEPTGFPGLQDFIKKIKKIGLLVKLDTNGSRPEMLEKLFAKKLIDYVAMDIKNNFDEYAKTVRVKNYESRVKKSIKIILQSGVDYEFRTTIVPGIHNLENLTKLAKELKVFEPDLIWYWQAFKPQNCLDERYLKIKPFPKKELEGWFKEIKKILPQTRLRNLD